MLVEYTNVLEICEIDASINNELNARMITMLIIFVTIVCVSRVTLVILK